MSKRQITAEEKAKVFDAFKRAGDRQMSKTWEAALELDQDILKIACNIMEAALLGLVSVPMLLLLLLVVAIILM